MNRRELLLAVSGMSTMPRILRAQQKAMPVIGFLTGGWWSATPEFGQGLRETGYALRQNLAHENRWAEFHYDRLPALAAELVRRNVDVIVAYGDNDSVLAAKNATSTIPIVFTFSGDPVAAGLVASLARPGGNLTGFSTISAELTPKRLELLSELVPQARQIALLVNPNNQVAEALTRSAREAVRAKGLMLHLLKTSTESDIDAAFVSLVQLHAGALVVAPDSLFWYQRAQLVALASRHAVPTIYTYREESQLAA